MRGCPLWPRGRPQGASVHLKVRRVRGALVWSGFLLGRASGGGAVVGGAMDVMLRVASLPRRPQTGVVRAISQLYSTAPSRRRKTPRKPQKGRPRGRLRRAPQDPLPHPLMVTCTPSKPFPPATGMTSHRERVSGQAEDGGACRCARGNSKESPKARTRFYGPDQAVFRFNLPGSKACPVRQTP